jgi:hypothetical protein
MKNYSEIRKEEQAKVNQLITDCKVFFAFSNQQFQENKTELKEGEKYVSIGAGGYMPKSYLETFSAGMKDIKNWAKTEIKKAKQGKEEHILHELNNYECFYTNNIEDVIELLPYPKNDIWKVFHKYRESQLV